MDRQTDKDGRCTSLLDPEMKLSTGVYKLVFHTGEYFSKQGVETLYPFVEVCHQPRCEKGETDS
jgi:5-hydroxyisourate hydrolase